MEKAEELQIALWLQKKLQPESVLNKLGLDRGMQSVLIDPNRNTLSACISMFNQKNPSSKRSLIGTLSSHYGDFTVAKALVTAKNHASTRNVAAKLQMEQLQGWMNRKMSADDVFTLLKIKDDGVLSMMSRKLGTLEEYIKLFSSKNPTKQANLVNILSKGFGGEDKFALLVMRALQTPHSRERPQVQEFGV